jgi:AbiV family abortive infection protein
MYNDSLRIHAEQLHNDYYAKIRNHRPDFADDLLREVLRCYPTESYTAVCILCRAAVEESLKEIYELLGNLGHPSIQKSVENMELENLKQWAYRLDLIDHFQFDNIGEIQHRGNRSAHGPTADISSQLEHRQEEEQLTQPLEIWADQSDALKQIDLTSKILHDLKLRKAEVQSKGAWNAKYSPSKIPEAALAEGSDLSYRNAQRFITDAELLLSQGSHGHSTALAMYALEESAKSAVLQAMQYDPTLRDDLSEKIAMRKHVEKFMVALHIVQVNRNIETTDEIKKTLVETSGKLQSLKERGLYVDYYDEKWLTPLSQDLQRAASGVVKETRDLLKELDKLLKPIV